MLSVTTFWSFVREFPRGDLKWALVRANLRRSLKLSDELTVDGEVFEYLGQSSSGASGSADNAEGEWVSGSAEVRAL